MLALRLLFIFLLSTSISCVTLQNGNLTLTLTVSASNGIFTELSEASTSTKLTGRIGIGIKFSEQTANRFVSADSQVHFAVDLVEDTGFNIHFATQDKSRVFQDCFTLDSKDYWLMGREGDTNQWPTQNIQINSSAHLINENNPIWEAYWLNSKGGFVFVDPSTPLFIDQNNLVQNSLCLLAKVEAPYAADREMIDLNYTIGAGINAREGHLIAIKNLVGKPFEVPNVEMMRFPTWSTAINLGKDMNEQLLYDFAQSVKANGYRGQVQIVDGWENCYGLLDFDNGKFPNLEHTLMDIRSLALKLILAVHPFINKDCDLAKMGLENHYLMKDEVTWWNGKAAYLIDFYNPNASAWFTERITKFLSADVPFDGLLFQAGEASYIPPTVAQSSPNSITTFYNQLANISTYMAVQSGWRTHSLPVFITIPDKESNWSQENGLRSLIVNLLQLNFAGYTFVSPGLIGGKSAERPSPELYVRWIQAVTFMPVMNFGYLPWEIISSSFDVNAIAKKFIDLHYDYSTKINNVMKKSWTMGLPVNGPIWWIEPNKTENFQIVDQFMLGEDILIAPVLTEGATKRDIYLPPGKWEDGQNYTIVYDGSVVLKDYPAPIDVLPFFMLKKT